MVSTDIGNSSEGLQEEPVSGVTTNGCKTKEALHISTSQSGLLGQENRQKGFLGSLTAFSNRVGFLKIDSSRASLSSPSAKFLRFAEERDQVSRSVPNSSSHSLRERLHVPFLRDIDWNSLAKVSKEWIRNPLNMALLVWIICVAVSGAILFMVMIGMLNHAIPRKSQRNAWFEVNNQILNALFTLMCLYQHPKRFYHLVLLCKWRPEDISKLRKVYCKNGTYKPREWAHMMVVVFLLNLNCFAQYALCGLNLGYKRSKRPAAGVGICISVAIGAAAASGVYTFLSPLGKDYECEVDPEAQDHISVVDVKVPIQLRSSLEKRFSFALREDQRLIEDKPKWKGGLWDLWDDISVSYLSLFCSFCVFGWNMERIGFGNMYVHILTFVLFCSAPFWIFYLAAINIDNGTVREAMGITGVVLCIFGLLYGGFWRIQLRKRFNLPANNFCCGMPAVADCTQWLFCCWCSLAQEVRTVDFYEIVEDKSRRRQTDESEQPIPSPFPREDISAQLKLKQSSPSWGNYSPSRPGIVSSASPSRLSKDYDSPVPQEDISVQLRLNQSSPSWGNSSPSRAVITNSPSPSRLSREYNSPGKHLSIMEEESSVNGNDNIMMPPIPSLIHREDDQIRST